VARVKRAAERKLIEVEQRIAALERIRSALAQWVSACPGHGLAKECPILEALGEESIE
jgi:MerR family transcriptional regulator, copper efflux regulator